MGGEGRAVGDGMGLRSIKQKEEKQMVLNIHYFAFKYLFIYLFIYLLFRAAPVAYGGSQARGPVGAVATGLRHSPTVKPDLSLGLQPSPQLTATLDP